MNSFKTFRPSIIKLNDIEDLWHLWPLVTR